MKRNLAKISKPGENKLTSTLQFVSFLFTKPGAGLVKKIATRYLRKAGLLKTATIDYNKWINDKLDSAVLKKDFEENISSLLPTRFSIVMMPDENAGNQTEASIASLVAQSYDNWELCISNNLAQAPSKDERIRVIPAEKNAANYLDMQTSAGTGVYFNEGR